MEGYYAGMALAYIGFVIVLIILGVGLLIGVVALIAALTGSKRDSQANSRDTQASSTQGLPNDPDVAAQNKPQPNEESPSLPWDYQMNCLW